MRIRKYLSLYWAFFRASLTADLEFRANFAIRIATDIFWYVAQIASFEVLFNFVPHIGGWSREDMRVFLGVLFVADGIWMVLFSANLDSFSESVRKGNLDLLLAKPVNSQFMISCQRAATANLGNLFLAFGWLIWSCWHRPGGLSLVGGLLLLVTIPCGVAVFYAFRFVFSAAAVIFARAENLQHLWYHFYRLGLRPDTIYPPWLHYFVLTAVPVGMIASVPARLLLGTGSPWLALWAIVVSLGSVYASHLFWNYALSRYTSASS